MASYVENFFNELGLMAGPNAPAMRSVVGALAGAAAVQYFQPNLMYTNGTARPWSLLTNQPAPNGANPTNLPWYSVPILGAFICGVLI